MSIMELGALGEFVGAFAVVATLIYLTIQVRQNAEGVHVNAELQMGIWWSDHNRQMIFDREMVEVVEQGMKDARELSDPDRRRFTWWLASMFYMFDVLYKQHARGGLLEDSWNVNELLMMGMLQNEAVGLWWESGFFNASREFHGYVEGLRQDGGHEDWEWVDIARTYDAVRADRAPDATR